MHKKKLGGAAALMYEPPLLVPLVETELAENITLFMEPPEKKKLIPPLLTYVFEYCYTFISILLSGLDRCLNIALHLFQFYYQV